MEKTQCLQQLWELHQGHLRRDSSKHNFIFSTHNYLPYATNTLAIKIEVGSGWGDQCGRMVWRPLCVSRRNAVLQTVVCLVACFICAHYKFSTVPSLLTPTFLVSGYSLSLSLTPKAPRSNPLPTCIAACKMMGCPNDVTKAVFCLSCQRLKSMCLLLIDLLYIDLTRIILIVQV